MDGEKSSEEPTKTASTRREHLNDLMLAREQVHAIIKRHDDNQLWDGIKAKDIDPQITSFVIEQLQNGFDFAQVRRQLGIYRATDKSWTKIMAAIKQGFRIDGPAFLVSKGWEYQTLSTKLLKQINTALDEGIEVVTKEGGIVRVKGPSKELAMTIDTYNRLNQGFVKLGQDLGAFVDADGKQGPGGGGVVIQINSNIQLPTSEQIEEHRRNQQAIPVDKA